MRKTHAWNWRHKILKATTTLPGIPVVRLLISFSRDSLGDSRRVSLFLSPLTRATHSKTKFAPRKSVDASARSLSLRRFYESPRGLDAFLLLLSRADTSSSDRGYIYPWRTTAFRREWGVENTKSISSFAVECCRCLIQPDDAGIRVFIIVGAVVN